MIDRHPSRAPGPLGNARAPLRTTYQGAAIRFIATFWVLLLPLFAFAATTTGARAESRVALVVGNGKYLRDPLPNPPRDAALIARTLRRVGFKVIDAINADRRAMQDALVEFNRKLAQPETVGLFYYAGHGVQVNGDNYLLPIDVDIRTESEVILQGINLNEILATLRPNQSRLAVAVLDACRNNPFSGLVRGLRRGLAPVNAPAGTLIAFSTAPGEVALDGDGTNSPYTQALARAIPTPGLAIEEVFKRTRQSVMRTTSNVQVPWEHSSLTGRFFFVPQTNATPDGRDHLATGETDVRLVELTEWERAKNADEVPAYKAFLKKYPSGAFAELAAYKIEQHPATPNAWTWWLPKVTSAARPASPGRQQAEELFERALRFEAEQNSPADIEHARTLYQAAAESGLAPAMYRLARLIEREARRKHKAGGGKQALETELKIAAGWYAKGAQQNHPASTRALGTLYEFGEGVGKDLAEALSLYKTSAEAGDAGAMTSLGFLYATGKGVHRNPKTARSWYARAASAGSERAMFNLAIMLMSQEGGAVNLPEAARWLTSAAQKDHAGAKRQLAVLYDEGRGLRRDPGAAALHLLQAYAAGDRDAKGDLFNHHRRWSRSTRRAIQRQLKTDGLYTGAIHGTFNASTFRALSRYQSTQ